MAHDENDHILKTHIVSEPCDNDEARPFQPGMRDTKHHNPSHARKLMSRIISLFDEKPYEVKEGWGGTIWHLSKRLLTLCILVAAIVLGIMQQSFKITDRNIWGKFQVSEDAQLAVFGLLNTLLALMVRDSLNHITDTIITKSMISNGGASSIDFEMYDETIKPWKAVINTHRRRKRNGWSMRDGFRFTICAATGICLLLQGASMNTIGMPKLRWWPDTRFMKLDSADDRLYLKVPTTQVANVSYMSMWQRGFNTVNEGGVVSWEVAHAIGAMSTLGAFESIHSTFSQPAGWTFASGQGALVRNAVNVTYTSTPSIQAISVHGGALLDIWDNRKNSTFAAIRTARGWDAYLKLNGILLDTVCYETSEILLGSWKASNQGNGTITIQIGPATEVDEVFPGATCSITIGQALIDVEQWIVSENLNRDRPDYSIDGYEQNHNPKISRLAASAADKDIAKQLSDWFNAILPNLQLLSSNGDVANLTSLVARLANVIVELGRGHTTMDGLSVVLSVIFSNFLTTFSWAFEEVTGNTTRHGPVRWQIYGSGPRLPWEWVSAAVIGVSIIVQLVDIFYVIWHRKAKGTWLSLGGMLLAANAATRMPSVTDKQGAGFMTDENRFVKYYVRGERNGDGSVKATLIDEIQFQNKDAQHENLEMGRKYC